jgi:hypothetical protein
LTFLQLKYGERGNGDKTKKLNKSGENRRSSALIFSNLDYLTVGAQNFSLLPFLVRLRLNDAAPHSKISKKHLKKLWLY